MSGGTMTDLFGPRTCEHCGSDQPVVRVPRSFREALVGGVTCRGCGNELDRYGRTLPGRPSPYWYWMPTLRSSYVMSVASLLYFGFGVLAAIVLNAWAALFFFAFGMLTLFMGLISIYAHRRWPVDDIPGHD